MKKLIVLSVVFALVAGVAFAADVSGEVVTKVDILKGDSSEDSKVNAGGWPGGIRRLSLVASGEDESGVFGGWFRFQKYGWGDGDAVGDNRWAGYAWWKPIEQVRIQLGNNPDGFYGRDGVTGWGFYQVGGDTDVIHESWAFGSSFYGGWNQNGLMLSVTPIENLFFFLGIPFPAGGEAKDVFGSMHIQVAYDISNIGQIALSFVSDPKNELAVTGAGTATPTFDPSASKLYAFFDLKAVDNLGVNLGIGYTLPVKYSDSLAGIYSYSITYNSPVAIGLGLSYNADAFGIKARFQGQFGGSIKSSIEFAGVSVPTDDVKLDTVIDVDILPSYAINDKATILLSAGLQITAPDEGDAVVGWHIEPYVSIKSNWWAPNFYFGIRLDSAGKAAGADKAIVNWSIPMGIAVAF